MKLELREYQSSERHRIDCRVLGMKISLGDLYGKDFEFVMELDRVYAVRKPAKTPTVETACLMVNGQPQRTVEFDYDERANPFRTGNRLYFRVGGYSKDWRAGDPLLHYLGAVDLVYRYRRAEKRMTRPFVAHVLRSSKLWT